MTTILTKAQLMDLVIRGGQRECFTHSEAGTFDVTAMRQAAPQIGEIQEIPLSNLLEFIAQSRVVDRDRVLSLPEESWRSDPGIFVVHEYDAAGVPTVTMIDGHHRAMRRALEGMETMQLWFIPIEKAIRPAPGWVTNPYVDWGDPIVDGKIIRKTEG